MNKRVVNNNEVIAHLQTSAKNVLDSLIPEGAKVCLLDYPNNTNVGDSLIWLGEIEYLKYRKARIQYVCDIHNYDYAVLSQVADSDTILLLHGGGNFGTFWPKMQEFRERIIQDFPNNIIIQLPQSIHYADQNVQTASARIINQHKRFTIIARDANSQELARNAFDVKVLLSPDMAFFIGSLSDYGAPTFDRFILSRTDHEKKTSWTAATVIKDTATTVNLDDWLDNCLVERLIHRIEIHTDGIRKVIDPRNLLLLKLWNLLSRQRLRRGMSLLKQGRIVITDRLHAHILSLLMNKPHVIIDNADKKVSNLFKTWTNAYSSVTLVDALEHVEGAAKQLDSQLR